MPGRLQGPPPPGRVGLPLFYFIFRSIRIKSLPRAPEQTATAEAKESGEPQSTAFATDSRSTTTADGFFERTLISGTDYLVPKNTIENSAAGRDPPLR